MRGACTRHVAIARQGTAMRTMNVELYGRASILRLEWQRCMRETVDCLLQDPPGNEPCERIVFRGKFENIVFSPMITCRVCYAV